MGTLHCLETLGPCHHLTQCHATEECKLKGCTYLLTLRGRRDV